MVASAVLPFFIWFISSQMAHNTSTQLVMDVIAVMICLFDKRVKMATSHLIQSRRCKINAPNKFTAYMIS